MAKVKVKIFKIRKEKETVDESLKRLEEELGEFMSIYSGTVLMNNGIRISDDFIFIFYGER